MFDSRQAAKTFGYLTFLCIYALFNIKYNVESAYLSCDVMQDIQKILYNVLTVNYISKHLIEVVTIHQLSHGGYLRKVRQLCM